MLIGFIGDVHGRVFHALAAVITWQIVAGRPFDLLIQVGDLGAYPDPSRMDAATQRYLALDPAEADFSRLLEADGPRAEHLRRLRTWLARPVHFIRGNHEDFSWLRHLPLDATTRTAAVDPFDLFHYVPDGTALRFGSLRVAFLGGIETSDAAAAEAIDDRAYQTLLHLGSGQVDVLVTHDAPYGVSRGYFDRVQGSRLINALVEQLRPTVHVAGHLTLIGPLQRGDTTFLCLEGLVASPLWEPSARGLQPGCLAVLDTALGDLWAAADPWLADFDSGFDFDTWVASIIG
jgi:hypothetical protein